MTKAIRIHTNGGPEVMLWEDVPTPEPGPNEALIKHEAIGLNFMDVYVRTGLYKAPNRPRSIGQGRALELSLAVGPNVSYVAVGMIVLLMRARWAATPPNGLFLPTAWSNCPKISAFTPAPP